MTNNHDATVAQADATVAQGDATVDQGDATVRRVPTRGPYDLARVATMGFGHRDEPDFDGVMRLAFCVDDDYETQAGVAVRQHGSELELTVDGAADLGAVTGQVARVVSVYHDGEAFAELGRREPEVGRLQAAAPGFRPALFYSPYEAAVWSVISARRARAQAIRLRQRLIEAHGRFFDVAGVPTGALPTPSRLRAVTTLGGLPADRIPRLHAIAEAALRGELSATHLQQLGPDAATTELQRLPGIGPFYASLVVIRGTGFVDVPVLAEPQSRAALLELYGRPADADDAELLALTDRWRPFRTWVAVLARVAGGST
ncbi:MAG: DNA-3-methyladenine glycosylase family protein [Propionibacteriaceae bacterium]